MRPWRTRGRRPFFALCGAERGAESGPPRAAPKAGRLGGKPCSWTPASLTWTAWRLLADGALRARGTVRNVGTWRCAPKIGAWPSAGTRRRSLQFLNREWQKTLKRRWLMTTTCCDQSFFPTVLAHSHKLVTGMLQFAMPGKPWRKDRLIPKRTHAWVLHSWHVGRQNRRTSLSRQCSGWKSAIMPLARVGKLAYSWCPGGLLLLHDIAVEDFCEMQGDQRRTRGSSFFQSCDLVKEPTRHGCMAFTRPSSWMTSCC
mmetsp:Transcript_42710/g.99555  ORF Transcript_42710/g.99555 Transcript_42710/m.99555 type:complete len:257 (+) Transcript_42710:1020-1790(+)